MADKRKKLFFDQNPLFNPKISNPAKKQQGLKQNRFITGHHYAPA
jgi:hypothetical protein